MMKGVSGKNEFSLGLVFIVQEKRNEIMEQWNVGMVGNTVGFPVFQDSIIPIFQSFSLRSPGSLRFVVLLSLWEKIFLFPDPLRIKAKG